MPEHHSSSVTMHETTQDGREWLASFLGTGPGKGDAFRALGYIGGAALVAVALGCGMLIERFIGLQSVLLVFLVAIVGSAVRRAASAPLPHSRWQRVARPARSRWQGLLRVRDAAGAP